MPYRFSQQAEAAIYEWADHVSGCDTGGWSPTVIWDKPGKDRPELPYITLNITNGPIAVDNVDIAYLGLDSYEYTYMKMITLSVNIFDNDKYLYYMNVFLNSFSKDCCYAFLKDSGLAYWYHYGPFNIGRLDDAEFEFRAMADIILAFGHTETVSDIETHKVKINNWNDIDIS